MQRSAPASEYSKQGDTPSVRLSKLGYGPYPRPQDASGSTPADQDPDTRSFVFHKPKYIENGDPLQDEEKLRQGPTIVEPGDEAFNTIRKVPSDQALFPPRWGSSRRATGRSRSGLQVCFNLDADAPPFGHSISVLKYGPRESWPCGLSRVLLHLKEMADSETLKILVPNSNSPPSLTLGEAMTGKSIIYAYNSSSSSSSGRTTCSFGAVGEHLASSRSAILPGHLAAIGDRTQSTRLERAIMSADSRTRSPLADLVLSSTPDEERYQLLALGHSRLSKHPFTPRLIKPSSLCTLVQRRRSLSDLKEAPQARRFPAGAQQEDPKPQDPTNVKVSGEDDIQVVEKDGLIQRDELDSIVATDPPVWSRKGLPFEVNRRARSGLSVHLNTQDYSLDPETFSLPFGVGHSS